MLEPDGGADPALRPDVCGVIFDYSPDSPFGELYTAWEVESGAAGAGAAEDVLRALAERFLVLVVGPGPDGAQRRFAGPDARVRRATDLLWSRGGWTSGWRRPLRP